MHVSVAYCRRRPSRHSGWGPNRDRRCNDPPRHGRRRRGALEGLGPSLGQDVQVSNPSPCVVLQLVPQLGRQEAHVAHL
eukprot:1724004-Rhodomonas_salina.2